MGNAASAPGSPGDARSAAQQQRPQQQRPAYAPTPYSPTPYYPQHLYSQQGPRPGQVPTNGSGPNGVNPYAQYPQPPPRPAEQTQRTNTIRNNVNLKKPTLKLVPVPEEPGKFTVQFTFDAASPCWVSVFFLAKEEPGSGCRLVPRRGDDAPTRVARPLGLAQKFTWEELFDPARFNVDDLVHAEGESYPLIIRLETLAQPSAGAAGGSQHTSLPDPAGCALPVWVQSQTTYATLQPQEQGAWAVRVVKQRIWVDGVSYELQEIYGIENCATGNPEEDAMAGKECVVCLSEARDTTVLPCRHMCMCSGCARMLRHQTNRCPICRTPVESLLEIKVERRDAAAAGSSPPPAAGPPSAPRPSAK